MTAIARQHTTCGRGERLVDRNVRPRRRQPTSDEPQTQTRPNIQLDIGIGIGSRGGGRT
jgi:hypothetical protein